MNIISDSSGSNASQSIGLMDVSTDSFSVKQGLGKRRHSGEKIDDTDTVCKKISVRSDCLDGNVLLPNLANQIFGVITEYTTYFTAVNLSNALQCDKGPLIIAPNIFKRCVQSSHSLAEVALVISEHWNRDEALASAVFQAYYKDADVENDEAPFFHALNLICIRLKDAERSQFITFVLNSLPQNIKRLSISLVSDQIQDVHLDLIGNRFSELESLNLDECRFFSNEGFIAYANNPRASKLVHLSINRCEQLTNKFAEALSQSSFLERLESLSCTHTNQCSSFNKLFVGLNTPNLKHLDITTTPLGSEEDANTIASHLTGLEALNAFSSRLAGPRVCLIAEALENLKTLVLSGNGISDACMERIANSEKMQKLQTFVDEYNVTDAAIVAFANSRYIQLENLSLGSNLLTDRSIVAIAESPFMKNLVSLSINNHMNPWVAPKEMDLSALTVSLYVKKLEVLRLKYMQIKSTSVALIAASINFRHLRELRFHNVLGVTDEGLIALSKSSNLMHVKIFDLYACRMSDKGLMAIANSEYLLELEELHLNSCRNITDNGIDAIATSASMQKLRTLDLGCCTLSDAAICAIANSRYMARLQEMKIQYLRFADGRSDTVSNASIAAIANSPYMSQLQKLLASGNDKLTSEIFKEIAGSKYLSQLRVLEVPHQIVASSLIQFSTQEERESNPQVMLCKITR